MAKKKKLPYNLLKLHLVALAIFLLCLFSLVYIFSTLNNASKKTLWTTYVNTVGKFSIQYPSSWTITESHELSNRVVDNSDEINTTTLKGSEGIIVLQWGPMGFGGGCDQKYDTLLQLKQIEIHICSVLENNQQSWNQIYSPNKHQPPFGAYASFQPQSEGLMRKVFSTLSFTN